MQGGCFRKNCKFKHTGSGSEKKKPTTATTKPSTLNNTSVSTSHLPIHLLEGLIPINSVGLRLDIQRTAPTPTQWAKFDAHRKNKKPCTNFHLGKSCSHTSCAYSHDPLGEDEYYVLQYIRHEFPCSKKGKCRRLNCFDGHVCQKEACANGKVKSCKMTAEMHSLDRELADWVKPIAGKDDVQAYWQSSQSSMETFGMPDGDLIML